MNGLWESPPDRDLPPGRLAERREHLVSEIRQKNRRTASTPGHRGRRGVRPRIAAAIGALALGAFAVVGGAIWLSGESGDDAKGVAATNPSSTSAGGEQATGINAVLAVHSVRAVTGDTQAMASEDGGTFPYLVLDLPGTELDQAYEVVDADTGEAVGIQAVYHQRWTNDAGDLVGRELLLRVQEVGQDYEWLAYLTELAESSQLIRIGDRDVTVYRIPDEKIEEGFYDLDVLYWVEKPGVEAILIPWGLSGEEATGLMAGLQTLSADEWLAEAGPAPDPDAPATTVVGGG